MDVHVGEIMGKGAIPLCKVLVLVSFCFLGFFIFAKIQFRFVVGAQEKCRIYFLKIIFKTKVGVHRCKILTDV